MSVIIHTSGGAWPMALYSKVVFPSNFSRCDIEEEPEDDDEALQASYTKTVKKKK